MEAKGLNQLRDEIHENAVKKGFYKLETNVRMDDNGSCVMNDTDRKAIEHALFAQKIALIHSELSEALEADRKGRYADFKLYYASYIGNPNYEPKPEEWFSKDSFKACIKNSIEDELADVIIRTLDLCGYLGIDIEKHVEMKMKYNKKREYKHGKNY